MSKKIKILSYCTVRYKIYSGWVYKFRGGKFLAKFSLRNSKNGFTSNKRHTSQNIHTGENNETHVF